MTQHDIHSLARPDQVRSTHLELELQLDFDAHVAAGTAWHDLDRADAEAPFVVDTAGLTVERVVDGEGNELAFVLGDEDPILGRALSVSLGAQTARVGIVYRTSPTAEAMQWLEPAQTSGGAEPFVFTQGQAILTRTWIPLQDSPGVRVTWNARITAPAGLTVVMSASQREVDGSCTTFVMDKPVPSYLIALACGDLACAPISERCAVWAEPSGLELAAAELSDMEAMVQACEQLFGPYRWGRYDVLILPPSFPFGGMENPCLTFATPTILAGDKSLVSLIAHELAHSWSGNLVTNATWRDFWLNEGFTVYLEDRIMEHVYGTERAHMEIALGMQALAKDLAELPPADQVLHIDLQGRNPDDGMTQVPYQKGAAFIRRLEQAFGRERLDAFLRTWFDSNAFESVTTEHFLHFLGLELLQVDGETAVEFDVSAWVFEPGLPDDAPVPTSTLFAAVDSQLAQWQQGAAASTLQTDGWATQQWLRFLDGLSGTTLERLVELDEVMSFSDSGNSEILAAWLVLAVRAGYRAVDGPVERFLLEVGRRKFLKPLYEALLAAEDGEARARAIYEKARPRYHAVSQRTLDAMLGIPSPD